MMAELRITQIRPPDFRHGQRTFGKVWLMSALPPKSGHPSQIQPALRVAARNLQRAGERLCHLNEVEKGLNENGKLVVAPIEPNPEFDLNALVAQITDENRHEEIGTGPARGGEFS